MGPSRKVAIIGAGAASFGAAQVLRELGVPFEVFEKSRGVGGRLATRRIQVGSDLAEVSFDHGAQFISCFSQEFGEKILPQVEQGALRSFFERNGTPRWISPRGMNALAKSLAQDLGFDTRLRRETRVIEIQKLEDGFFLKCEHAGKEGTETQGPFDHVLLTAPVPQALELLDQSRDALSLGAGSKADWEGLRSVHYYPCIAWMVAFPDAHLSESWLKGPGYLALEEGVDSQMISWIASNRKKGLPSAAGIESLTVHLNPKASNVHFTGAGSTGFRNVVLKELVALGVLQGQISPEPVAEAVHRWRYSQPVEQYPDSFFSIPLSRAPLGSDSTGDVPGIGRIVLCGDAFRGARVEGAFLSGRNAALHLRPSLVSERGQD